MEVKIELEDYQALLRAAERVDLQGPVAGLIRAALDHRVMAPLGLELRPPEAVDPTTPAVQLLRAQQPGVQAPATPPPAAKGRGLGKASPGGNSGEAGQAGDCELCGRRLKPSKRRKVNLCFDCAKPWHQYGFKARKADRKPDYPAWLSEKRAQRKA